jgi:hypothetical protein
MSFARYRRHTLHGRHSYGTYEGGKNGRNLGRFRFVWADFGGVSSKFHWLLFPSHRCPKQRLSVPLSTTFAHILRLNGLLSIRKLQVETAEKSISRKALEIVVNRKGDPNLLRLGKRFLEHFRIRFRFLFQSSRIDLWKSSRQSAPGRRNHGSTKSPAARKSATALLMIAAH